MIHRIGTVQLRTGDALNKREERERRRQRRDQDASSPPVGEPGVPGASTILEEERERVTFDLVA